MRGNGESPFPTKEARRGIETRETGDRAVCAFPNGPGLRCPVLPVRPRAAPRASVPGIQGPAGAVLHTVRRRWQKQPEELRRRAFPPKRLAFVRAKDSETKKTIATPVPAGATTAGIRIKDIAEENLTAIFDAFSRNKIHVNLMQNSAVSFSVCFNEDDEKLKNLIADLGDNYLLKYNTGLQLITIRHYNDEVISELTHGKLIFLEQKSRATVQFLIKG